jgi:hypothetical protein
VLGVVLTSLMWAAVAVAGLNLAAIGTLAVLFLLGERSAEEGAGASAPVQPSA